jgi:hypothetical protein
MDGDYDKVGKMFKQRLESELSTGKDEPTENVEIDSKAYLTFKEQYMPKHLSFYEKFCEFAEKTLNLKPDPKNSAQTQEYINLCHLNVTPTGVYSAAIFLPLIIVLSGFLLFFMLPTLMGNTPDTFVVIFVLIAAAAVMVPMQNIPKQVGNSWRLKASNQMVLAVFYVVTYMRHTSNLELAINFAAEHLDAPLSLDMRKIIWDVETQKFESVKESLDDYLVRWRKYNMEFVEAMHLIQSSLLESDNSRRLNSLDKSLTVILDETYERMLHYAHNLKGPLTTLNMLGVVLPILTLVILPLVVSFMDGFRWFHLFAIYNIALPSMVYLLGKNILSTRPGGSGKSDVTKKNPELAKYKKIVLKSGDQEIFIEPKYLCLGIFLILLFIGFIPVFWNLAGLPDYALYRTVGGLGFAVGQADIVPPNDIMFQFIKFRERLDEGAPTGEFVGPFGLGSTLMGILVPLSIGLSYGLYNKITTKNIMVIRNQAKALELEFSSALFQLGSRIGDGLPAEIAFGRVAGIMEDTVSGKFFTLVHINITRLGMSVQKAIFDNQKGALKFYPSDLIESSMKVLVESSRKGPLVASQALINVSEYIKQMHRVDERLQDLMGDVISSMRSQALFLTPVISSIVVSITSMITKILGTLGDKFTELGNSQSGVAGSQVLSMFGVGIPTYQFQIVVGLYVIQLAYILTVIGNGIENGPDKVSEGYNLGVNMTKAAMLYSALAFVLIIAFNIVASNINPGL